MKEYEVARIELDAEHIEQVKRVLVVLHAETDPPTPGCDCALCKIKLLLMLVVQFAPEMIDEIIDDLAKHEPEWKSGDPEKWREMVAEYFDGSIRKRISTIIRQKYDIAEGGELVIGGESPWDVDDDDEDGAARPNMKPAEA